MIYGKFPAVDLYYNRSPTTRSVLQQIPHNISCRHVRVVDDLDRALMFDRWKVHTAAESEYACCSMHAGMHAGVVGCSPTGTSVMPRDSWCIILVECAINHHPKVGTIAAAVVVLAHG